VDVRLVALKLTLCHLNASCERNGGPRRTGLVPPFKAFGDIAQDLIADAILGLTAHMGDNSPPARQFAEVPSKIPEISEKIAWTTGGRSSGGRRRPPLARQAMAAIVEFIASAETPKNYRGGGRMNWLQGNWSG
ncbi:hypothetical protein, partial [Rhizobium anhuiense]|uniref:hypothetical protein n=1 Tax=Rhizobium anhuiense TaxID=1184720 RepID=UPI0015CF0436